MWKAVKCIVWVVLPCLGVGAIVWMFRRARLQAEWDEAIKIRLDQVCDQVRISGK